MKIGKFRSPVLQRRRLTPDHRRDIESSHPATLPRPERRQETPLPAGTDDGLTCQDLLQFDNDRPVIAVEISKLDIYAWGRNSW